MPKRPKRAGHRARRLQGVNVLDKRILKSFGNPLREQIMWILNERTASPSDIADELGEPLNSVCYEIKVLRETNCIELVEKRIVGSTVEHFYRANMRFILDDVAWPKIAGSVQSGMRATLLKAVMDDAVAVVSAGTYDELPKSHMSWVPMASDEQGRDEISLVLLEALTQVIDIQDRTRERLEAKGEEGEPYTVSILSYPAIHEGKVPPGDSERTELSASEFSASTKAEGGGDQTMPAPKPRRGGASKRKRKTKSKSKQKGAGK